MGAVWQKPCKSGRTNTSDPISGAQKSRHRPQRDRVVPQMYEEVLGARREMLWSFLVPPWFTLAWVGSS